MLRRIVFNRRSALTLLSQVQVVTGKVESVSKDSPSPNVLMAEEAIVQQATVAKDSSAADLSLPSYLRRDSRCLQQSPTSSWKRFAPLNASVIDCCVLIFALDRFICRHPGSVGFIREQGSKGGCERPLRPTGTTHLIVASGTTTPDESCDWYVVAAIQICVDNPKPEICEPE